MINIDNIKFDERGLIPAIIQQAETGTVLMLAYMNKESLVKTVETGVTWFFSRSRQSLWQKGETSGHVQKVQQIYYDCDGDTLLVKVEQTGVACHEGTLSCFSRELGNPEDQIEQVKNAPSVYGQSSISTILHELYHVVNERKRNPQVGSYTTYLFEKGQDKILKKVGEEAAETIIASKNNSKEELLYEMADLWYHCLVLLAYHNVSISELMEELQNRRK